MTVPSTFTSDVNISDIGTLATRQKSNFYCSETEQFYLQQSILLWQQISNTIRILILYLEESFEWIDGVNFQHNATRLAFEVS